jgi:hypothetical protein
VDDLDFDADNEMLTLSQIADEYGDDFARRVARAAVRESLDGEPFLVAEELERVEADIMLAH